MKANTLKCLIRHDWVIYESGQKNKVDYGIFDEELHERYELNKDKFYHNRVCLRCGKIDKGLRKAIERAKEKQKVRKERRMKGLEIVNKQ